MEKKYIINFEDNPGIAPNREKYYKCCEIPWWVAGKCTLSKLTPYTEPDLEQVREEAYEDGYKTAKVQCNIQAEKDMREVGERHYQHGLNDAWEAARWLAKNNAGVNFKVFGMHFTNEIVQNISASECIEKIRQYEQEKEEQIQVGDEVATKSGINGICTNVSNLEIGEISLVFNDGSCGVHKLRNIEGKTGRHFPEITEVLAKMRESNDNK